MFPFHLLSCHRRRFLASTIAASLLPSTAHRAYPASSTPAKSIFTATELNHLSLEFEIPDRAEDFYRVVMGMTSISHGRGGGEKFMHFPQGFINILASNQTEMNHFCMSIRDFEGDYAFQALELAQTEPFRMGGRNLHCYDPDRINVQVQEEQHGWGRIDAASLTEANKGLFKTLRLHHLSLNVTELQASQAFYQEIFGMPLLSDQGDRKRVLLGIGSRSYLELIQADQASMNHCCYAVANFDPKQLPAELKEWTNGEISYPEPGVVRFRDPGGHVIEVTSADQKLS